MEIQPRHVSLETPASCFIADYSEFLSIRELIAGRVSTEKRCSTTYP